MTPFFGGDHASLDSDWCSCSPSNNMCSYYGPWFSNNEWHTFSCISTSQFSDWVQGAASFGHAVLRRLGCTLRGDIQSCDGGILGLSSDLAVGSTFFSSLKDQKRIFRKGEFFSGSFSIHENHLEGPFFQ